MIKVLVNGAKGRMGTLAVEAVRKEPDLELVGTTDLGADLKKEIRSSGAQVVVDFTQPQSAYKNTEIILLSGAHPVVGTTGFKGQDIQRLQELAVGLSRGGIIAPNFAIGAVLLMKFASDASRYFPDLEIIELHHQQKADAPSGTAIKTADWIHERQQDAPPSRAVDGREEKETLPSVRGGRHKGIPIHSVRLPGLVAHQEVILGGVGQILTIRHDATSRECFMPGVVLAIRRVPDLKELVYGLERLLNV